MKRNGIVAMSSRLALATVFVAVAALVLACGSSYPSESVARKIMEDYQAEEGFRVRSFTKTNGMGDDQRYTLEFDAELESLRPMGLRRRHTGWLDKKNIGPYPVGKNRERLETAGYSGV